jgi:predicted enzyme related to lactoylglutathione lyase
MKIKVTKIYVDDQSKALRFYTEVLDFAKKTDFSQGPFSLADRGLARGAARH